MTFTPVKQIPRPAPMAGLISWTLNEAEQIIYAMYFIILRPDTNLWIMTIDPATGETLSTNHLVQPYLEVSSMSLMSGELN